MAALVPTGQSPLNRPSEALRNTRKCAVSIDLVGSRGFTGSSQMEREFLFPRFFLRDAQKPLVTFETESFHAAITAHPRTPARAFART